jgi:hypothetical protein
MHSEEEPKPDPSLEALAARLRALPEPSVPAGLEARLLAAVSTARPGLVSPAAKDSGADRQAWFALASTVLALAIVGLLAVFAWQNRGDNGVSMTEVAPPVEHNSLSAADELTGIALSPLDRRMLSGLSPFHWPVEETRPANVSVLRGDLLD